MTETKHERIRRRLLGLSAPRRPRRSWSETQRYGLLIAAVALWTAFLALGPCGGWA